MNNMEEKCNLIRIIGGRAKNHKADCFSSCMDYGYTITIWWQQMHVSIHIKFNPNKTEESNRTYRNAAKII